MRRIALVLATVVVIGMGMASTGAQAHEGWRGDYQWRGHDWREHEWRDHRDWRAHAFERHVLPRVIFGLFAR